MFLISIFLFISKVIALEEGDACVTKGSPGVCELLTKCPYADKLVRIDEKRPTHCGWVDDKARIETVCCPNEDLSHAIGVFARIFKNSRFGEIYFGNKVCKYHGDQPFICCPEPKHAVPREPIGCPPIPEIPNQKKRNDLIWRKCQEYQRYLYPCVSSKMDDKKYERKFQCAQDDGGTRIFSGVDTNIAEFPHMALLGCRSNTTKWVAGGSLISDRFILTAAHAINHDEYGSVVYALLGTETKSSRKGQLYNIIERIPHAHYQKDKYNDIALLKLDKSVEMSQFIKPICLPMKDVKLEMARYVTGWGAIGENKKEAEILQKAVVTVYDKERCRKEVDHQHLDKGWIHEIMLCAGDDNTRRDSCKGDSGGPLQAIISQNDFNCTYVIEGIVSRGPTCGQGYPGVYTRVKAYLDWITKRVWPHEYELIDEIIDTYRSKG